MIVSAPKSISRRYTLTIALLMFCFFILLAVGTASLGINRLSSEVEGQLAAHVGNKLQQVDLRLSYILETVNAFSSSSLTVNSLIDVSGRSSYFPHAISELARVEEIQDVVAFDFSGNPILFSSEKLPAWFTKKTVQSALLLGKRSLTFNAENQSFIAVYPTKYFESPQGGIAVEISIKKILMAMSHDIAYMYTITIDNHSDITIGMIEDDALITVVKAEPGTTLAQFATQLYGSISKNTARKPILESLIELLVLGLIGMTILIIVAFRVGERLAKPIILLTQKIRNDEHPCGPVGTADELELLAESFDEKTQRLLQAKTELEFRVEQRTIQLQQQTEDLTKRSRELEQLNKELEIAHDELMELDHMKDEFISVVSHELRTPLTSILGSIELLVHEKLDNDKSKRDNLLKIASSNCWRLSKLINDLLDFQKISSGTFEIRAQPVPLDAIIEEVLERGKGYCDKFHVSIRHQHKTTSGLMINADSHRIQQVLDNLISNAIKHSPDQGIIEIYAQKQESIVRINIRDQGEGVPEHFQDKIFNKFCQANTSDTRSVAGTGLGLSISKSIMEAHGGKIGYTNAKDGGAIFWIEMAIHSPTGLAASNAQRKLG